MICHAKIVTTLMVDEPSNLLYLACPIRVKYHDLNTEDHGQPFAAALPMQLHAKSQVN